MADTERLLHAAQQLARGEADVADLELVRDAHPADLAHVLQQLAPEERHALFRAAPFPVECYSLIASYLTKSGPIYEDQADYRLGTG